MPLRPITILVLALLTVLPAVAFEGVPTDVAGFVGVAESGPIGDPVRLTTYEEFVALFGFGADLENPYLAPAVAAYFLQGGEACWIVRAPGLEFLELTGSEGLGALTAVDEIAIVAMPGCVELAVQAALIAHCREAGDRFGILDPIAVADQGAVQAQRAALDAPQGHAALYYPWVIAAPDGEERPLPPSGFVAGRMATSRADQTPVGPVVTATGVTDPLNSAEADALNQLGINPIRDFGTQGVRIWGGRTLSSDPQWRYIAVRRTASYLAESVTTGTEWVVLEPNTPEIWQLVRIEVEDFLFAHWTDGWFQGTTPEDAYFVRCDATTHSQDDLDSGRTVIVFGFAMLAPAEFQIVTVVHQRLTTGTVVAGRHGWIWDGRDDAGRDTPSGTYLVRATIGSDTVTRPLTLAR